MSVFLREEWGWPALMFPESFSYQSGIDPLDIVLVLLEEHMWRSIFDCKVICELWKKRGEILHSSLKTHIRLHSIDLFINLKGFEVT